MNGHVLVLGEALVDIVRRGPARPVEHVGGSPLNVAVGLGRLGRDVEFVTHIGDDDRGRRIVRHLADSSVRLAAGSSTAPRTPTATATLDENGAATYEFDLDHAGLVAVRNRWDAARGRWKAMEVFAFGPWASVSDASFARYVAAWRAEDYSDFPGCFAWLANALPGIASEASVPCNLETGDGTARPQLFAQSASQGLAGLQREGISFDRLLDIYAAAGNDLRPHLGGA